MPWKQFRYTRQEVYDAVWSEPMRDAAKRFGISNVALAKICRKLNVPRPRQGYWLRKEIGAELPRKPLPLLEPGQPSEHVGERWREPAPDPARPTPSKRPRPPTDSERIVVPNTLGELHPCVKAGLAGAKKLNAPGNGIAWTSEVPISVSAASRDRALRIMNALMLGLEARGHRVEARPASRLGERWRAAATGVHVGDAFVEFSMFERSNMVRTGPPPKKRKHESADETWTRICWPKVQYVPNGKLTIRVRGGRWYEQDWTDQKHVKLESRLHEVVAAILAEADAIRARRIEEQREREAEIERAKREIDERRRREIEEQRAKHLVGLVENRRLAREIRKFIQEANAIAASASCSIRPESQLGVLISWAARYAERIDPLTALRTECAQNAAAATAAAKTPTPPAPGA